MNNKKVFLVIILFIGISFIVYSFANPLAEEDFTSGDGNTGITENNTGNNDDSSIDNSDIVENDDDEEEEDVVGDNEEEGEESKDDSSQIAQNPSPSKPNTTTPSTPKPSTPKYKCKYVGGKYYGKNGNVIGYTAFVNECDSKNPTLTLKGKFDEPYTLTIGGSKNVSDFYSPTFGILGGSVTCKNGNAVIKNLNELKSSGLYNIECEAIGGNGKSSGKISIPVRVKPVSNVTAFLGTFPRPEYVASNGEVFKNSVTLKQDKNKIYITGEMLEQPEDSSLKSKKYITINYIGQRQYTPEEIAKAEFYVNSIQYRPTIGVTPAGQSYVSFKMGFRSGNVSKVKIDWGDGSGMYEYELHFDVKVLTINEIEQEIKDNENI